jgi:hypothetical protein
MQIQWSEVCKVTQNHELSIKTVNGDNVTGYCLSVDVDEISVRTRDGKIQRLARTALKRMRMQPAQSSQLRGLGKFMHDGLRDGFGLLFSPLAPAGMVLVPGTIAWGAVSAPFCALADLGNLGGKREIKVM